MGSNNTQEPRTHTSKSMDRYIGKSERTAGVSYVAISRGKSLASCVIEPMTYERLTCLKSSANLQYRLEEENRLDQLAQTTSCAFRKKKTVEFWQ